ncbi:SMAD/FHA domain-containing protein [Pilobolus umbonatus]|nr:SMAD/FHA domain-containing protein [Pilobolus umbonatus]
MSSEDRYIFDQENNAWFDTITQEYSQYDEATMSYITLNDDYWKGHPEGTQSLRLVVQSSPFYQPHETVLVDESGITVGRDRSWDRRLRLPEMIVSKYHCMIFLDKKEKVFFVIDVGSQHGTFVNDKRLSNPKQSSLPYELRHLDILKIGSTVMQVHNHNDTGWPCEACVRHTFIETDGGKKNKQTPIPTIDMEQSRREWIRNTKRLYRDNNTPLSSYVDRADMRRQTTVPESHHTNRDTHDEVIMTVKTTVDTPVAGIGSRMLQKLGWEEGQGLGRNGDGIIEPIVPHSQLNKSGLGTKQDTHESKKTKNWRYAQERYNKLQ